jgi:hypothetical protein
MANNQPAPHSNSPRGMSLTVFFGICVGVLILAVAGLGLAWYLSFSDKAKLERQVRDLETQQKRSEVERKKADGETKNALAKNQQNEVLVLVRQATNAMESLLHSAQRLTAGLASLKTNAVGRTVALHPDLVAQARRLYDNEAQAFASVPQIVERLESARRIEQQLLAALGTTYEPDATIPGTVQSTLLWAESEQRKVNQTESLLTGLQRESKVKVLLTAPPADPPTLTAAIQQLMESETGQRQKTILAKTTEAKSQATDAVAKAEADRIVTEAKAEADKILMAARETAAAQQRDGTVKQAEIQAKQSDANLQSKKIIDAATMNSLKEKAARPDIQAKLAPFITPGYLGFSGISYDKQPLSYAGLQTFGALNPTATGLQQLVNIAYDRNDKVRPRWKLGQNSRSWQGRPEYAEFVKESQALLIELGPALVELGMLKP